MNNSDINVIQSRIDYVFKNPKLLIAAFTHSSYVNEHEVVGNERIEFLRSEERRVGKECMR